MSSALRLLPLGIFSILALIVSCSHLNPPARPVSPPGAPSVQAAAPAGQPPASAGRPDPKMFVEDMLVGKGLGREKIHALVSDPRVEISPGIITSNLFYSAPKASAKNPKVMDVSPAYIGKGVAFIAEHANAFNGARERYKVSPEVITAILVIETNLGKYPMKYNVFRVYASLTSALDTEYLDALLKARGDKYVLTGEVLASARKKGAWGLGELVALIQLSDKLGIDPIGIQGSFAGALGPAQFIPTSFVKFGADGNGDGRVDPFDMDDCIASVANYLKLGGWKEDAKLEVRRRAIWNYNHHEVYVNTVMMLYDQLVAAGREPGVPDEGQAARAGEAGAEGAAPGSGPAPVKAEGGSTPVQESGGSE